MNIKNTKITDPHSSYNGEESTNMRTTAHGYATDESPLPKLHNRNNNSSVGINS